MSGENKVIKVYESFRLGFCDCECGEEITIRSTDGYLKRFKHHHHTRGKHAKIGEKGLNWKGGIFPDSRGYLLMYKPDHPNADKKGYVYIHRWVMSEFLGRPLLDGEEVHHKDGNIKNHDISNLQLLSNSEHSSLTNKDRERKLKDMSDRFCSECGGLPNFNSKGRPKWMNHPFNKAVHICNRCYMKIWHKLNKR